MGEEVESEMVRLSSLGIDLVRLKEEVPKYCSTLYVCVCVCVCVRACLHLTLLSKVNSTYVQSLVLVKSF